MFDARSNTPIFGSVRPKKVNNMRFTFGRPFFIIPLALLFLLNALGGDMSIGEVWAARSSSGLTSVGLDSAGSPSPLKSLGATTFTLPQELGYIQESVEVPNSGKTVIHIQDAHCNYAAQKKISDILNYLTSEYGIYSVNCEGGAEGYDLSIFTDIPEKDIREKTSDYFVKEGIVSAAEYYAVNNSQKVSLWGVEDPDLYLKNLKVYRDSLAHKAEVDSYIKSIGYILDNLKRHIYSNELLEFDKYYTGYKENKITFKEYMLYLIAMAQKRMISIESFSNVYLLSQTLADEDKINFKRANNDKDEVVDKLKKSLSRNELEELMVMVGKLKTERISQADFYAYLVKKAKSIKLDLKDYTELQKYIVYISIYGAIDRTKVTKEIDALEDKIRESLYENDTQRELGILSKNLTLTKNIFNISLTRDDFTYCMEHRATFAVANYVKFIDAEAPLYKIRATLDKNIDRLDQYRDSMDQFYQISLERDKAFIKNIKFTDHDRPNSIIITGGFHTENLRELFKNEKVSYISIMPKFKNEKGYESPYIKRLAGQRTALENVIDTAIPAILNLQVVEILSKLGLIVEGKSNIEYFRLAVQIIAAINRGQSFVMQISKGFVLNKRPLDEDKAIVFTRGPGDQIVSKIESLEGSVKVNARLISLEPFEYKLILPEARMPAETRPASPLIPGVTGVPNIKPLTPPSGNIPTFIGNMVDSDGNPITIMSTAGFAFTVSEDGKAITMRPPGLADLTVSVSNDQSDAIEPAELSNKLRATLKDYASTLTKDEKDRIDEWIKGLDENEISRIVILEPQATVKGFIDNKILYLSRDLIKEPLLLIRPEPATMAKIAAEPTYEEAKKIVPEIASIMRRGSPTYLISPAIEEDIAPTTSNNRIAEQILGKQGHRITAKSYPVDEKWVEKLEMLLRNTMPYFEADLSNPTTQEVTRMAIRFMPDAEGKIAEKIRGVIRKFLEELKKYTSDQIEDILDKQIHLIPISIQRVEHLNSSIDLFTDLSMMEIDRYLKGAYPGEELPVELRDRFLALLKLSITNFDDLMKVVKTKEDIKGILEAIFKINVLLRIRPVDWKSIDDWKRENNAVLQSV